MPIILTIEQNDSVRHLIHEILQRAGCSWLKPLPSAGSRESRGSILRQRADRDLPKRRFALAFRN